MVRIQFPGWWQRRFLLYECAFVVCLGAVSVVYGYRYGGNYVIESLLGDSREVLYSALAPIFASLFGFIIAATSIILGLSGNVRLAIVKESDSYGDLWKTLFSAIKWLGVGTIATLVALVLDRSDEPKFWIVHAVLILTGMVVVRLWRCVWILQKTIDLVTRKSTVGSSGNRMDETATAERSTSKT